MLCERFGAFTFGIVLAVDGGNLEAASVSTSTHPLAGLIIAYRGWLVSEGEMSRKWSSGTRVV
jgi:hypothetical protein